MFRSTSNEAYGNETFKLGDGVIGKVNRKVIIVLNIWFQVLRYQCLPEFQHSLTLADTSLVVLCQPCTAFIFIFCLQSDPVYKKGLKAFLLLPQIRCEHSQTSANDYPGVILYSTNESNERNKTSNLLIVLTRFASFTKTSYSFFFFKCIT